VAADGPAPVDEPQRARRLPRWGLVTLVVLGILALGYGIAVATTIGGVPKGTTVVGVDIGGQSEVQAAATLEAELADEAAAPVTLTARDAETVLDPASVGLALDARATAKSASGPIFNPVRLLEHLTGQFVEIPPITTGDDAAITTELREFAQTADEPPVEPAIDMAPPTPVVSTGQPGEGLDLEASLALIRSEYLVGESTLELPVVPLEPTVSDEEAELVLTTFAIPAISGDATVTTGGTATDTLTPALIRQTLSFAPEEGALQPQLNVAVLREGMPALASVSQPGQDATWDVSSGTPVVVPSRNGTGVSDTSLSTAVLEILPQTAAADRSTALVLEETQPDLTTEQAQALNVREQLSSFTQKFEFAEYRRINCGTASKRLNGTLLQPGDTFSMNETIGERTKANGYVSGIFISGGRFEEGLGGGVSIATTATWTAAFFAGLEAVEVNPHSLFINRYQPGLEATIAWGQLDLRFRNNSGNGVLITSTAGDTYITVTMWGTKVYSDIRDVSSERYNVTRFSTVYDQDSRCTPQGGVNGFTIDVWRVFYQGGAEVEREKFTTRYDPTTRVVCGPKPGTSPPPSTASPPAPST
jgi:vancomycin resistance protein YoaR